MDTLIHADIFFFITTIVLIVISIGLVVIIIYVIKILHDVSGLVSNAREEGEEIVKDIKQLRLKVKDQGLKFNFLRTFVGSILKRRRAKRGETQE